jgi:5-methylcytosine-specific restriction protein A
VRAAVAVADLLQIHPRAARRLVALAAAVFPTTLDGQAVEPKLPATAAALGSGRSTPRTPKSSKQALSTDAAGRIDPPRWAAAKAQLAGWARLCRPDELARMATC